MVIIYILESWDFRALGRRLISDLPEWTIHLVFAIARVFNRRRCTIPCCLSNRSTHFYRLFLLNFLMLERYITMDSAISSPSHWNEIVSHFIIPVCKYGSLAMQRVILCTSLKQYLIII